MLKKVTTSLLGIVFLISLMTPALAANYTHENIPNSENEEVSSRATRGDVAEVQATFEASLTFGNGMTHGKYRFTVYGEYQTAGSMVLNPRISGATCAPIGNADSIAYTEFSSSGNSGVLKVYFKQALYGGYRYYNVNFSIDGYGTIKLGNINGPFDAS